ncbi:Ancient conserved domain protein 2 [Heterostelium album PN500]|uniref:Ancient conserved domain protein 2 n=1 Tax=Heterostelium pallidum (strain ATCC 26659 / Pp 5 / PN500) TaxID=670386 RepID=D3BD56_HETP5|nr:Ancient conserved domain protein 2 [Heterostelium album PN500]EFA80848.1 Ancient conserved domain protein 2 [Heterostelium album PN500]|eukprot:XP_020432967.1 Ancient conserved domain protein 2 [Heterostelium album PN500]
MEQSQVPRDTSIETVWSFDWEWADATPAPTATPGYRDYHASSRTLSGLFAGLTLGIMSLDITGLEIVIASGSPSESKYAKKIYPVRQRGNLLLCTLLLGNVSVNTLLSILMADMTSGFVGFLLSTAIILIAGEIIPQAACSRHALAVGAHTIWIALDVMLGSEMGTIYSRQQLKKLLDIHSTHAQESGVSRSDVTLLTGVLDFAQKKVMQVMTPLEKVFMLDIDTKLDTHTLTSILENGHSRMPVYDGERTNIVGCLYMRDLVILNPEDNVPLRTVLGLFHRQLLKTWHDTTLEQMLNEFKTGKSHMAIVHKVNSEGEGDPFYENLGIICLEDVLEEILQDEILDEADNYENTTSVDYKTISSFHGQAKRTTSKLSPQQVTAIYSFLSGSMPEFASKLISEQAFSKMLSSKGVIVGEFERPKKGDTVIYNRGVVDEYFTIVLQGKLEIKSGSEGFVSEGGPFTTLGVNALKTEQFTPEFTARVISHSCQLLRISKSAYDTAMRATADEYNSHVFKKHNNDIDSTSITTYHMATSGSNSLVDDEPISPPHPPANQLSFRGSPNTSANNVNNNNNNNNGLSSGLSKSNSATNNTILNNNVSNKTTTTTTTNNTHSVIDVSSEDEDDVGGRKPFLHHQPH